MASPDELDPLDFGDGPPPLDFGHRVLGRWVTDKDGNKIGINYSHPMPNPPVPGRRCFGGIYFDIPEAREAQHSGGVWQLHSLEPLEVSPSLLCGTCGHHGFIRGGSWVPA